MKGLGLISYSINSTMSLLDISTLRRPFATKKTMYNSTRPLRRSLGPLFSQRTRGRDHRATGIIELNIKNMNLTSSLGDSLCSRQERTCPKTKYPRSLIKRLNFSTRVRGIASLVNSTYPFEFCTTCAETKKPNISNITIPAST